MLMASNMTPNEVAAKQCDARLRTNSIAASCLKTTNSFDLQQSLWVATWRMSATDVLGQAKQNSVDLEVDKLFHMSAVLLTVICDCCLIFCHCIASDR